MSPIKRLRCFVVGCNNEYSSRHLLLISEPLKTQRINVTFIFEGNASILIYINASMFARIIRNPASSTEEVSEYKCFYESLQIAFPNNMLVRHVHKSLRSKSKSSLKSLKRSPSQVLSL